MLRFQRLMENYKGEARVLWEKKVGDTDTWVDSVSFLLPTLDADPSTSQILYYARGLGLVSVEDGRPLTMSLDTTGLEDPHNISVSRDQRTLAVVGGLVPGSWWCTYSRQEDSSWDRGSTHKLSYRPSGVTWTGDGCVVITGEYGKLEKFSTDGLQVWARTKKQTQNSQARGVAACNQGRLYCLASKLLNPECDDDVYFNPTCEPTDYGPDCVLVYSSSSGELQDSISLHQDAILPQVLCVTPRGTVFVSCKYRSRHAVFMRLPGDTQWLPIITKQPKVVRSLAISGRHLAVGDTGGTLRLYEVT